MTPIPTHSGPAVTFDGLTKHYGDTTVVDDLCLEIQRGEIFGILGTNGAGKTTAVECAQGLRRPDAGSVSVLGHDPLADRAALAGRVGSQLQDSHLPERMRVGEAVRLFADSSARADEGMAEWDLEQLERRPFGALSGGQRQRLLLALAFLNRPDVVFLDELTQGLDPDARRSVWDLIEQTRSLGTTIVLVTHFTEEAERLCDRIAVMAAGRLQAQGSPTELVDRYGGEIRVRFSGGSTELDWARCIPSATVATRCGTDIEVRGPSAVIAQTGHALVEHNTASTPLRVQQPDLEQALFHLLSEEDAR
ncbi:MAG: ABC transporter ATP-binding protein [Actinomycetota bacterium]